MDSSSRLDKIPWEVFIFNIQSEQQSYNLVLFCFLIIDINKELEEYFLYL